MFSCRPARHCLAVVFALATLSGSLFAHPGHSHLTTAHHPGAFQAGWLHPLMGLDHLLAMVAVGLVAFRVGGRWRWLLPVSFLGSMFLGGLLAGVSLPGVEFGIAMSVLVLGLLVAMSRAASPQLAIGLVIGFAFFHGHAHAAEMLTETSFSLYAAGFLLSTALLHFSGVAVGAGLEKLNRSQLVRYAGGGIAVAGLMLMVGLI